MTSRKLLEALNARWVCDALGMLNRKDTRVLDLQMYSRALTPPNFEAVHLSRSATVGSWLTWLISKF